MKENAASAVIGVITAAIKVAIAHYYDGQANAAAEAFANALAQVNAKYALYYPALVYDRELWTEQHDLEADWAKVMLALHMMDDPPCWCGTPMR